jgi:hypothetical protein
MKLSRPQRKVESRLGPDGDLLPTADWGSKLFLDVLLPRRTGHLTT